MILDDLGYVVEACRLIHSRDRKCQKRFVGCRRSVVVRRESTSASVETLVKGAKYKLAWLVVDRGAACNAVALVLSLAVFLFLCLCPLVCTCLSLRSSFPLFLSLDPSPSCAFFRAWRGGAAIGWMSDTRTLGRVRGMLLLSHVATMNLSPAPTPSKNPKNLNFLHTFATMTVWSVNQCSEQDSSGATKISSGGGANDGGSDAAAVTLSGGGSCRRGSFPSWEKGLIFARWLALFCRVGGSRIKGGD